jgi:oligopeptide transport system substrate-binding protein
VIRFLFILCAVLTLGLATPWCTSRHAAPGLVIAVRAAVTLDPLQASRLDELRLLDALFDPLVRLEPQCGTPQPALARAWTVSTDGLTWSFALDPAARWSDGSPVLPAQALAGLERHRGGGSVLGGLLAPVVGLTVSGQDLVLQLDRPVPWLPAILALPVFAPLHPQQGRWHDPRTILGNGPMVVTAHVPRDHDDLAPSATYVGPTPAFGALRLRIVDSADAAVRLYLDGQVDAIPALPSDAARDLRRHAVPGLAWAPALGTELYRLRCAPEPLDPRLRSALSLACDRATAVRELLDGQADPAVGLVPPAMWELAGMSAPTLPGRDLPAARRLLAAMEVERGPRSGWPVLELWVPSGSAERLRVAEYLADAWRRDLGVALAVRTATSIEVRSRENQREYALVRGSLTADFLDPLTFLAAFRTGDGYNRTGWSDVSYDALLAQSERPGAARGALLSAAAAQVADAVPCIPLWHYRCTMLIRPGLLGIAPNPLEQVRYAAIRR